MWFCVFFCVSGGIVVCKVLIFVCELQWVGVLVCCVLMRYVDCFVVFLMFEVFSGYVVYGEGYF